LGLGGHATCRIFACVVGRDRSVVGVQIIQICAHHYWIGIRLMSAQ
jgi:hypothetical protein